MFSEGPEPHIRSPHMHVCLSSESFLSSTRSYVLASLSTLKILSPLMMDRAHLGPLGWRRRGNRENRCPALAGACCAGACRLTQPSKHKRNGPPRRGTGGFHVR